MLAMMLETQREENVALQQQHAVHMDAMAPLDLDVEYDDEVEATPTQKTFSVRSLGSSHTPGAAGKVAGASPSPASPRGPMAPLPRNNVGALLSGKPITATGSTTVQNNTATPVKARALPLRAPVATPPSTAAAATGALPTTRTALSGSVTGRSQISSRLAGGSALSARTGTALSARGNTTLVSARGSRASSRCNSPTSAGRSFAGKSASASSSPVIDGLRKKLPSTAFSTYSFENAKYLRELAQRRQETVVLRVLPKAQQLEQLVELEQMQREGICLEEDNNRCAINHKRTDEYNKKRLLQFTQANKVRQEALKRRHAEDLASQKTAVTEGMKATEQEIKDRLKLINTLLPRNAVFTAALADLKKEDSDLSVLGAFLEEEKRLQKGLKADARFATSKTASADGGAITFWMKQCAASAFNVQAIISSSPYRASVLDLAAMPTKLSHEKRVLTIHHEDDDEKAVDKVLLWAQTRLLSAEENGAEPATSLLERMVGQGTSLFSSGCQSLVLWCKEDYTELAKLAKQDEFAGKVLPHSSAVLSYDGVSAAPLLLKDVKALGELAIAA